MNVRQRMLLPAPTRNTVVRGLAVLAIAVLTIVALPHLAPASSVQVEAPGVSLEAEEESGSAKVSLPGLSVEVSPSKTHSTPEGEALDLSGIWKFKEDLDEEGHVAGWQSPEFDDSAWRTIRVPADWEEEGILTLNPKWTGYKPNDAYNGYGWYRRHFAVPADWTDATVRLRFGAIDDWDWTYVNGQLVGTTTGDETWNDPRDYALPLDILRPGEDNVIAVRVCDMGGGGGISEPPVELVNTSRPPASGAILSQGRSYSRTRSEITRFGGNVNVGPDEKVSGNVVVFGGDANIRGYVTNDVVAMGGTIRLEPGSRVDGDVVVVGGNLHRADGAVIGGDVVEAVPGVHWPRGTFPLDFAPTLPWGIAGVAAAVLGLLAWGFIALLGVLIMKDRLVVMADALPAHPARAALYGLIGFALIPAAVLTAVVASALACVLLAITIVGIPLIPAVLAALVALIVFGCLIVVAGVIAVAFSLGTAAFSLFGRHDIRPVWAVLVGVALLAIASHIPVLGSLVVVTTIIFGFGLAIMTGLGAGPHWAPRRLGFKAQQTVPEPVPIVPPTVPIVPPTVPIVPPTVAQEATERADDADRAAPEPDQQPPDQPDEEERPET